MAALTQITGTIKRINAKGRFQLEEVDDWFGVSDYAVPKPDVPPIGQHVHIGVDTKGFVRTLELVNSAPPASAAPSSSPAAAPTRETTITRLACLHAASRFMATRPDAKSPDVIRVAETFEEWIGRPA